MQAFDYIFNVGGNYTASVKGMTEATGAFTAEVESAQGGMRKLTQTLAGLDLVRSAVEQTANGIVSLSESGVRLDSQMHDLSAVAGVVGDDLKMIEGYARESAKAFGTDAGQAVESYKLILSQLSPEIAKTPSALAAMGASIQTTAKLMGGDATAAAQVLTTAMNQYGVSLDDPMEASRRMAEMMNVMAAAGQAGSAELPAISAALSQCGMAAKAANLSFEETNAAIQVLDKAGKKGSEGGVALRNTLSIMGQGRFLPKDTRESLQGAGIDVEALADTSKSLHERLEMLKPVLNDSALLGKLFGMENANAARALIQGTDALADFTAKVTGTTSAEEQAATVMDSYAERQARVNQQIEDFKISLFQATGDVTLWAGSIVSTLVPLSQLLPLLSLAGNGMVWIKNLQWASLWTGVQRGVYVARVQLAIMNRELATGQMASVGFLTSIARSTLAVVRFGTVGIFNALKGVGALILALVTGGTTSVAFATTASVSFAAFKVSATAACRAVSAAIMSIPIVGWIAAAIAALVALVAYFWNTSAQFRAVLKGLWASFKAVFSNIGDMAKAVFGGIGDLIKAAFSLDGEGIDAALKKMKGGFADFGSEVGKAFKEAYDEEMEASEKEASGKESSPAASMSPVPQIETPSLVGDASSPTGGSLSGVGSSAGSSGGGGGKISNVTISIEKLVEKFEIHTTNLAGDLSRVKDMVGEALIAAVNDVNLAV